MRSTISAAFKIMAFAIAVIVVVAIVRHIDAPEPAPALEKQETPKPRYYLKSDNQPPASSSDGIKAAQASNAAPSLKGQAIRDGKIFPYAAKAWVAPAVGDNDPSVGLFKYGVRVEILDRVVGPYGWDWLKV